MRETKPYKRVAEKVFRTGVQQLWRKQHRRGSYWYVRCYNRTYDSGLIRIPASKAEIWRRILTQD